MKYNDGNNNSITIALKLLDLYTNSCITYSK